MPEYTLLNWCEALEHVQPQRADTTLDMSRQSLGVVVLGTELFDFLQFVLPHSAVSRVNPATDIRLLRNVPVRWPFKDNNFSYAKSARLTGHGGFNADKIPAEFIESNTPPFYRYPIYLAEVSFEACETHQIDDVLMLDASVVKNGKRFYPEWNRRTTIRFQPVVEQLSIAASDLQFVEDTTGARPRNVIGTPIKAPFAIIESKGIVTVTWQNVPADFVLSTGIFGGPTVPVQFLRLLGKVNDTEFLGYAAGTLGLFDMPEFIVKPLGLRNVKFQYEYPWQYDIVIRFRWFDPPRGNLANARRGHNLLPPRGSRKYLYATRRPFESPGSIIPDNSDDTLPPLFASGDFELLFQSWEY